MWNWLLTHSPLLYLTQSVWRDEAFSILAAQRPVSFILTNLGIEPPLYYVFLHFWMKLFGEGEIAARSLSLTGFALATLLVIYWSEKLFRRHFLSWFLPILFFFNPMLLYYAFEVRTYGWFIFFATLSYVAYTEKRWKLFTLANVLGFYTHTYMIFVPIAEGVHWFITKWFSSVRAKLKTRGFMPGAWKLLKPVVRDPAFQSLTATALFMLPWTVRIAQEADRLKTAWYFPIGWNLPLSVLGNMFVGYEGTPWYLWDFTAYLSAVLFFFFLLALRGKLHRDRAFFFFLAVMVPLVIVIGVSLTKPLFVNRYLIPVTVAEVVLLALAIHTITQRFLQVIAAVALVVFSIGFNLWYPDKHPKVNYRGTFLEINALLATQDVVLAESPLVLFESMYYAKDSKRVFLYNPQNIPFPHYVGGTLVSSRQMLRDIPLYPARAFLVREDGTYSVTYTTPVTPLGRMPGK